MNRFNVYMVSFYSYHTTSQLELRMIVLSSFGRIVVALFGVHRSVHRVAVAGFFVTTSLGTTAHLFAALGIISIALATMRRYRRAAGANKEEEEEEVSKIRIGTDTRRALQDIEVVRPSDARYSYFLVDNTCTGMGIRDYS